MTKTAATPTNAGKALSDQTQALCDLASILTMLRDVRSVFSEKYDSMMDQFYDDSGEINTAEMIDYVHSDLQELIRTAEVSLAHAARRFGYTEELGVVVRRGTNVPPLPLSHVIADARGNQQVRFLNGDPMDNTPGNLRLVDCPG